jgi:hypothetical protein
LNDDKKGKNDIGINGNIKSLKNESKKIQNENMKELNKVN